MTTTSSDTTPGPHNSTVAAHQLQCSTWVSLSTGPMATSTRYTTSTTSGELLGFGRRFEATGAGSVVRCRLFGQAVGGMRQLIAPNGRGQCVVGLAGPGGTLPLGAAQGRDEGDGQSHAVQPGPPPAQASPHAGLFLRLASALVGRASAPAARRAGRRAHSSPGLGRWAP